MISLIVIIIIKLISPKQLTASEVTRQFWIRKTHVKSKKNVVVIGDSRIYRGVSIQALLKGTGNSDLTGVNLGYSSTGITPDYVGFTLERLDFDAEKKYLIIGISPWAFTNEAAANGHFYQYYRMSSLSVFSELYLNTFLKPYQPSDFIDSTRYLDPNSFLQDRNYFEKHTENGWIASYRTDFDSTRALESYTEEFTREKFQKKMVLDLINKLKELKTQGVEIIVFRPPSTSQMEQLENTLGQFDEQFVRDEFQKIGGHWVSFKSADFISYDGSHLHYKSAEKMSTRLGEYIKKLEY